MMRFTCRECPDSIFVLRFARFEALPGDAIHLQGVSRCSIALCSTQFEALLVMRFSCRECPDSAFVLCFTWFEALPGDAIHLQGASKFNMRIVFCTV